MRDSRYLIALGGFFGFTVTMFGAVAAGKEVAVALRDASIGCLIGAILLKVFAQVINHCVRNIRIEKAKAARDRYDAEQEAAAEREAQAASR